MTDNDGTNGSNDTTTIATKPAKVRPAKPHMGLIAAQADPVELEQNVADRRDAFAALREDPDLPDDKKAIVERLFAFASPSKPGMEEVYTAWKPPRVMIAQPTTRSEAKPDSAKNGDLYTTAGDLLERPFGIIPIYFHQENINFGEQQKNPICSSPDAKLGSPFGECLKCPHLPFGLQNGGNGDQQPTQCNNNIVCIALAADFSQIYTIQFGKTSRKAGSAVMSLAGARPRVWDQSYLLNTEKKTNDLGLYFIYKAEATGKTNDRDTQRICEALYALYIAERRLLLHAHYSRPTRAPEAAAQAEGQFAGGPLDAGLDGGPEPDLSEPPPSKLAASRTASKPM